MNEHLTILRAEDQLLISLCRINFTDVNKNVIRELVEQVSDWEYFVEKSNEHGIIALCWYNIIETGNKLLIPEKYLEILHNGYIQSLTRNTVIFSLLDEVLKLAEEEKIRIVLLKGLALEMAIYGNKGLRQMNDLDILVKHTEAIVLRKMLLSNGFKSMPMISPLHERILPTYGKHLPEMFKNGLALEIHFKLFFQNDYSLTDAFFESAFNNPVYKSGSNINIPEPQLTFLYLIRHLDRHELNGTSQLRLYTDLVVLLQKYPEVIINDQLFKMASLAGLMAPLLEKLKILSLFWGVEYKIQIPDPEIKSTQKTKDKFLHILHNPGNSNSVKANESSLAIPVDMTGLLNKVLFITGSLFPSIEFMKHRYCRRTVAGALTYYPIRWVTVLKIVIGIEK